jgi:5'-3' exonuclease
MIIVDLQQVMVSNIMVQMGKSGGKVETSMLKHMVLTSLKGYRTKYFAKYGELVLAMESAKNWRVEYFPYYKGNRKTDREKSTLDWDSIFEGLHEMRQDLLEYFPYRCISVLGCEADDVIGTLCHHFGSDIPGGHPILIMSGDKDFRQLQTYMNVDQYDPVRNRSMRENDPTNYLNELILGGDSGDGVPNVLSADNSLVLKIRQGTMTKKRVAAFKESIKTGVWENPEVHRNYLRNQQMIDLTFTPEHLQAAVLEEYNNQGGKDRSKIFNYLIKNRMKHLMENVQDF